MTALTEFERLEAQGSWRESPDARLREVVVSVGDASLILVDPRSEVPLSHWSLPAVQRLNPGKRPAVYAPGASDSDETVEIDDPLMIEAIERVHRAIDSRRAHPGRLRGVLTLLAVLAMLGGLFLWLPDALVRHAARVAPPAQTRAIGEAVLADITRSTGAVCPRRSGQSVLDWLAPQLLGAEAKVRVVAAPLDHARRLPGDLFLLGQNMITDQPGPEAAVGHLLAASLAVSDADVTLRALEHAGPKAALGLLTQGTLPPGVLAGHGQAMLLMPAPLPDTDVVLAAFAARNLPAGPYARSIDPDGESVLDLIEADQFGQTTARRALLTSEQWDALQNICAG